MKQQLIESSLTGLPALTASTVTTDPSELFFSAVQLQPSAAKEVKIIINGVSSTAQTTITAPDFYEIFISSTTTSKTFTVTGNVVVTLPIRFKGSPDPGIFSGDLRITGSEINTAIVSLSTANSPNPSFFPSALNFSTINDNQPSLPIEIDMTVSAVSASAKTSIVAPDFYQLLTSPTATPNNTFIITGSGTVKLFVRFSGSFDPGTFTGQLAVSGTEIISKTVPVKTIVLPTPIPTVNPASLSGFAAVEGGAPSAVQSFDLSVKGLPTQGKPVITATAPKVLSN